MRPSHRVLAGASVAFLGAALVACGPRSTDIADVSVVTTLPKEVGSGGFQKTIGANGFAAGVFYKARLVDCGVELDKVAREWAGQHGLTEVQRAVGARSLSVGFESPRFPEGAFVISYMLGSDRNYAQLHVTFAGASEKKSFSSQELEALGMTALLDRLVAAARCDAAG